MTSLRVDRLKLVGLPSLGGVGGGFLLNYFYKLPFITLSYFFFFLVFFCSVLSLSEKFVTRYKLLQISQPADFHVVTFFTKQVATLLQHRNFCYKALVEDCCNKLILVCYNLLRKFVTTFISLILFNFN